MDDRWRRPALDRPGRPITALEPQAGSSGRRPNVLWSNANVNENFPRADLAAALLRSRGRLLPLLPQPRPGVRHVAAPPARDGAAAAADHRRPRRADVLQPDQHPRRAALGAVRRRCSRASFNQFVGAEDTAPQPDAAAREPGRGWTQRVQAVSWSSPSSRSKTTWQYLFLTQRVERFEATVDAYAAHTHPDRLRDRVAARAARRLPRLHRHPLPPLEERVARRRGRDGLLRPPAASARPRVSRTRPAGAAQHAAQGAAGSGEQHARRSKLWELSRMVRADADLRALFATRAGGRRPRGRSAPIRRFRTFRDALRRLSRRLGLPLLRGADADGAELPGRARAASSSC